MYPALYDLGHNRTECRSIASHTDAHEWLDSLGAVRECTIHDVGARRESYIQFSWTREKTKNKSTNVTKMLIYAKLEKFGQEATSVFRRYNGKSNNISISV